MRLFEDNETNFNHLGICSLNEYVSCIVTEELNGMYELEMEYHMDSKAFNQLKIRRIIYCKPNPYSTPQPFRIYAISTPLNRIVTINAAHISYDLSGYVVNPFSAEGAVTAINRLKSSSTVDVPFNFLTDLTSSDSIKIDEPRSIRNIIGSDILETYNCYLYYDCFDVYFKANRGENNGVTIRYGKNLIDIHQEENNSKVYTSVYPYWRGRVEQSNSGQNGNELVEVLKTLREKIVRVPGKFNHTNTLPLDLSSVFDEIPTDDQMKSITKNYIKTYNIGIPVVSISIDFIQLTNSTEYEEYRLLDKIMLGDVVTVIFEDANIQTNAVCVKTIYDLSMNKYSNIELGSSFKGISDGIIDKIGDVTDAIKDTIIKVQHSNNETSSSVEGYVNRAIENLTNSITGNDGGYIRLNPPADPSEILVMDAETTEQATVVWRWNKSGLGVSRNGYNGPFVGIGVDGKLVVNENTAYKMTAAMIEGGILSGIDGKLIMSLQNDYFQLSHPDINTKTRIDSSGFFILDKAGEPIASLAGKDTWSHMIVDTIKANNIQNVYRGDANLYVDHSKNEVGTGSIDNPFSSFFELKQYLESAPIIDKDLTINIVSTGTIYDTLDLRGLTGKGNLTINVDKNLTISNNNLANQAMIFINCLKYIYINGGRTSYDTNDGALFNKFRYGVFFINCLFGEVNGLAIDTDNSGGDYYGILFRRTNGRTAIVDYVDSKVGLYADCCSIVYDKDSCGNCISAYQAYNGSTIMYGNKTDGSWRPNGSLDEITGKIVAIDDGATAKSSFRNPPDIPAILDYTQTFYATGFGTYQYAWSNWATGEWGNRAIQGVWSSYGNKSGHIFFNLSNIRTFIGTGTIKSASITLTRRNGGGYSSATNIYLNGSTCGSASGTPSYSNNCNVGSLSWGQKKTFTLPTAIVDSIRNGLCNSIACYSSSDTSAYAEIVDASITITVSK